MGRPAHDIGTSLMRTSLQHLLALFVLALISTSAFAAESEPAPADLVQVTLLADVDAVVPGQNFTLGVLLKVKEHWHTYWVNPGETGNATQIILHGPAGLEFGPVQWPLPAKINAIGGIIYGYENEVMLMVPVKVAKGFAAKDVTINTSVEWFACHKEECIEGLVKPAVVLPVSLKSAPANAELFQAWKHRLPDEVSDVASVKEVKLSDDSQFGLSVQWNGALPANIDFYPISTNAAVVQNVEVKSSGLNTAIAFKTKIYNADNVPQGKLGGLVVYDDASGRRHGMPVEFHVIKTK
jgi:thiol:disulfide interchange protein DsbD